MRTYKQYFEHFFPFWPDRDHKTPSTTFKRRFWAKCLGANERVKITLVSWGSNDKEGTKKFRLTATEGVGDDR